MTRGIEVLLAQALCRSLPWLGKVERLPGRGMSTSFNRFSREFAPAAKHSLFER